jgi:hypothetical protein
VYTVILCNCVLSNKSSCRSNTRLIIVDALRATIFLDRTWARVSQFMCLVHRSHGYIGGVTGKAAGTDGPSSMSFHKMIGIRIFLSRPTCSYVLFLLLLLKLLSMHCEQMNFNFKSPLSKTCSAFKLSFVLTKIQD